MRNGSNANTIFSGKSHPARGRMARDVFGANSSNVGCTKFSVGVSFAFVDAMLDAFHRIACYRIPPNVGKPIVCPYSIAMAALVIVRSFTNKCLKHQTVNKASVRRVVANKGHRAVSTLVDSLCQPSPSRKPKAIPARPYRSGRISGISCEAGDVSYFNIVVSDRKCRHHRNGLHDGPLSLVRDVGPASVSSTASGSPYFRLSYGGDQWKS